MKKTTGRRETGHTQLLLLSEDRRYILRSLMMASMQNNAGHALELLNKGISVNERDDCGRTPLMFAARNGRDDAVAALLHHGANVNAADGEGNTALHHAATGGHCDAAALLLKAGADLGAKSKDGLTPLEKAEKLWGDADLRGIVKLLKSRAQD